MPSKKDRRHDGWEQSKITIKASREDLIQKPELTPPSYWDDWGERRDGMRGYPDRTKKRSPHMNSAEYLEVNRWNNKIKKQNAIRKAKKDTK